ncbi:RNA-directed DNA polymerase, eukaryota, reverse transcriptase zinc-binding domain protein [Tanacetum coccineum]
MISSFVYAAIMGSERKSLWKDLEILEHSVGGLVNNIDMQDFPECVNDIKVEDVSWHIVGNDVCLAVKDFFKNGKVLGKVNATLVTLVPKVHKLNISKPYDTLNWRFLEDILGHFGLHEKMIRWIMTCVTTIAYTINMDEERYGHFKGGRGLRDGDHMSPYMDTIVLEQIGVLSLPEGYGDKVKWKCTNGKIVNFSIKNVWEDWRPNKPQVCWKKVVWYSQDNPRYSYILWLAIKEKLMTQDRMMWMEMARSSKACFGGLLWKYAYNKMNVTSTMINGFTL